VQIPLDRDKPVPLARQIQAHLERLITARLLAPGVKLPATRELAQSLGVNRATVALAYEELVAAGWARAHVGQGTFVAGPPAGAAAPAAPPAARPLNWSALLSRSARIVESDGERARAAAPGAVRDGVIERLLERQVPKFFYCQPCAHTPTGLTIRRDVAAGLLAAAARHQVPVVEDGFDGSLYYGARPPAPLKALDRDGVVVYIGTFSKVLFPGLRLGWVVAPPPLAERLRAAKQLADLHTSALIQAAVHRFCERRLLDRHVARIAAEYRRRRDTLVAALKRRMPEDVTWTEPEGGFSLLVTLPAGLDAGALLPRALERGVAYTPGAAFWVDDRGERTLRLSFSSVPGGKIDEGVRRLGEVVRAARRRPAHPVERVAAPTV